jgi:hypothetical protein
VLFIEMQVVILALLFLRGAHVTIWLAGYNIRD